MSHEKTLALEPAFKLAARLRSREISALELLDVFLARVRRLDGKHHAFARLYEHEARATAVQVDRHLDERPFAGVPIALKDLLEIEGRITEAGSEYFAGRVSECTATLVGRLDSAGVYGLGKTHTVEFAMGGWGTNQRLGTPWNPWDQTQHRAPGGSSSGSGVAVAAGFAPWAIGTDTGGSVRLPSAWCGLTGLKTTVGRISTFGIVPLSTTLDTPGPMCRCVEDAAHLFSLMQGADDHDPRTFFKPPADVWTGLEDGVSGLTLARLPDTELTLVEPDVHAAFEESLRVLESLGARIVEVALPVRSADMVEMAMQIIGAEGYSFYGALVDDESTPLDDDIRPRIGVGLGILAKDYLCALRDREILKQRTHSVLSGVDAVLTPTIPTVAPRVTDIDQTGTPATFTRAANLLDACALALPNGVSRGGLPTSLQIMCAGYEEALALRIGRSFQRETDWHQHWPMLDEH